MLKHKTPLSVAVLTILLSACQPKQPDPAVSSETAASTVVDTEPRLEGSTEKLVLKMPDCDDKNCPEFSVERLRSNQFVLDQIIDQAIITNLKQMLDSVEHGEQPASMAKATQSQSGKAAQSQSANASTELPASAAVTEQVSKTPAQHMADQVQPYLQTFLALDQELKAVGASHKINLLISPRILNSEAPLATVVINSSSYIGGAHGASAQTYYNFDLKHQKQIQLKDILQANQYPALEKLTYAAYKAWITETNPTVKVAEYEQAWKFKMSDNFYLGQQGLILQYGEYDIGPYVVGLPRLVIPYEQLNSILKDQYFPANMQLDQPSSSVVATKAPH
ncbi:uncharacterized protein DUF3298 [Acinetobacter calcoaceticus]|uniref:Uncharacterized protein DUF3298 n=1 Tax=Acinetobacter calcoaceticus TaxID=471 RepID=A0A4R1XN34_ACICA|nr:uncharacterized protein DUF3298 [Acinetobacter calcoaceticus]